MELDRVKALQNPANQPNEILGLYSFAKTTSHLTYSHSEQDWQGLFGWKAVLGETLVGDMGVYKKAYIQFFDIACVCEMEKREGCEDWNSVNKLLEENPPQNCQ